MGIDRVTYSSRQGIGAWRRGMVMLALVAGPIAAPARAADTVTARVKALASEADALRIKGDKATALVRAREAVALAEKTPGKRGENLFLALDALTSHIPDVDFEQQFATFDRLATVAATARGTDSYETQVALAGRHVLAFVLRKPGAALPPLADALGKATARAEGEDDRARVTGLTMVLAQLYDATGQHDKAVATIANVAKFYDRPPTVPNRSFAPGLMSLAIRYSDWQDWPRAVDAADRAITASVAYHGKRTTDILPALRVRGGAAIAAGRFDDAERDYREAVALADTAPDVGATTSALLALGRLYIASGRYALATPLLERTATLAETAVAQSNTRLAALVELYNVAKLTGDSPAATRYARLARQDAVARKLDRSANYVYALLAVANAELAEGRLAEAGDALAALEQLAPTVLPATGSRRADVLMLRARLAYAQGDAAAGVGHVRAAQQQLALAKAQDVQQAAAASSLLATGLLRIGQAGAGWSAGRSGANALTNVLVGRAGGAGAAAVDAQSLGVFDTTLDAAWAVHRTR